MNSTSRRTPNLAAKAGGAAAVAALLLTVSSAAMAQANLNIPGMAAAPPPPVVSAPRAAAPAAVPALPSADVPASQMPVAEVSESPRAAPALPPMPARPAMPAISQPPGVAQPAPPPAPIVPNRQVDSQLEKAQAEAVKRLNQLSPEGLASADPAGIGSDLDRMNVQQRKLRELQLLNQQADQVQKLYKTMFGDDVKIGQPPPGAAPAHEKKGVSEEEVKKLVEQARRQGAEEAEKVRQEKERDELALGPRPVVAQILGTGKRREAVVMLPCDRGSITVRVGHRLSQGDDPMRVTAISEAGVEVLHKGNRFYLGFGNVSSKCAPTGIAGRPAQSASASPSFGVQVPVMSSPLPISGPARMR